MTRKTKNYLNTKTKTETITNLVNKNKSKSRGQNTKLRIKEKIYNQANRLVNSSVQNINKPQIKQSKQKSICKTCNKIIDK